MIFVAVGGRVTLAPEVLAWMGPLGEFGADGGDEPRTAERVGFDFAVLELKEGPSPGRDGGQSRFARATGVVLFGQPAVANVPFAALPAFARMRADIEQLRHVALEIPFMIEEAAAGHSYTAVRLVVRLETPEAAVRAMWPSASTASAQTEETTTTQFASQVTSPVQVGLTRTRAVGTTVEARLPPTVVDEDRGPSGFGWKFQEQPGASIYAPRRARGRVLLALPRATRTLAGTLEFEAFTRVRRFGGFKSVRSVAHDQPPACFVLALGEALD
jgi:hypothetical protein